MLTQIINARILTPQGWLKDGSVLIRDNKILEVTNCDLAIIGAKLIDAKGMYIVPWKSTFTVAVEETSWKVRKTLSVRQSEPTCSMVLPVFFLLFLLLPFR